MTRDREAGMILINVLVILSLAATVVYAMLTLADVAIARSQGFRDAGEGLSLIQGAEQFAIAALRRDMIDAPDADTAAEPWGRVAQDAIDIPGGTLELRLDDAQGLFNVNVIAAGRAQGEETLRLIGDAAGLPPETVSRIATSLEFDGPVRRIEDLGGRAGLSAAEVATLGRFATALPGKTEMNLNAVPVDLLALLIGSGAKARLLVNRRDGGGALTPQDLESAQVVLPPGIGYRSDFFRLRTTARMGATVQSVESLLMRREGPAGPEVTVVERRNATPAALPPPPDP